MRTTQPFQGRTLLLIDLIEAMNPAECAPCPALADVLDAVEGFMSRFIVWPDDQCGPMAALWAAHTHVARLFYHTPRLMITGSRAQVAVKATHCRRFCWTRWISPLTGISWPS